MPTISTYVDVDFDIADVDDDDLIEELQSRGYKVFANEQEDLHPEIQEAIWRYERGYVEDSVLLLERIFPKLHGLHKRIKT